MRQTLTQEAEKILLELQRLSSPQAKKNCLRLGAREPMFGVATGAMKPLLKQVKRNQPLAMELYATGNFDAMYFAGMIADPQIMTKEELAIWIAGAYCYGLSDYVVAVTLAETAFAQEVADEWIDSGKELYASAGWACYEWLLGVKPDGYFDQEKLQLMLKQVETAIHSSFNRVRYAMNGFLIAVGTSYLPLQEEALRVAKTIGPVIIEGGTAGCKTPVAYDAINKAIHGGRSGFKRKNVRC